MGYQAAISPAHLKTQAGSRLKSVEYEMKQTAQRGRSLRYHRREAARGGLIEGLCMDWTEFRMALCSPIAGSEN